MALATSLSGKMIFLQPIFSNSNPRLVVIDGGCGEELMTSPGAHLHRGSGWLQSADAWRSQLHCCYNDASVLMAGTVCSSEDDGG